MQVRAPVYRSPYRLGAEKPKSIAGELFPFLAFVVGIPLVAWWASK